MCKTDKKTRNYYYFFAAREKPRKLNVQNELSIDFGEQNETE